MATVEYFEDQQYPQLLNNYIGSIQSLNKEIKSLYMQAYPEVHDFLQGDFVHKGKFTESISNYFVRDFSTSNSNYINADKIIKKYQDQPKEFLNFHKAFLGQQIVDHVLPCVEFFYHKKGFLKNCGEENVESVNEFFSLLKGHLRQAIGLIRAEDKALDMNQLKFIELKRQLSDHTYTGMLNDGFSRDVFTTPSYQTQMKGLDKLGDITVDAIKFISNVKLISKKHQVDNFTMKLSSVSDDLTKISGTIENTKQQCERLKEFFNLSAGIGNSSSSRSLVLNAMHYSLIGEIRKDLVTKVYDIKDLMGASIVDFERTQKYELIVDLKSKKVESGYNDINSKVSGINSKNISNGR